MSRVFTVKSRLGNYNFELIEDFDKSFKGYALDSSFLIADKKVLELYGNKIKRIFPEDRIIVLYASEYSKTLESCNKLVRELIEKGIRRNSAIFALGGGVIEDIAGFTSAIMFRGVSWIFIPTTLLAQADSCIGSKTSINLGKYKNLLGSFYPPSHVYIDVNFLKTLPESEIKSGIGEILHYYFIAGKLEMAKDLADNYASIIESPRKLKNHILSSLIIKREIIEQDELDKDKRNIFNYGHTFGHAIESVTGYRINHGQAVTMGMDMANYLSLLRGFIDEETFRQLHDVLVKNMPKFKLAPKNSKAYFNALLKDKKNTKKGLGCILSRGPGKMFKIYLPFDARLRKQIASYFSSRLLMRG